MSMTRDIETNFALEVRQVLATYGGFLPRKVLLILGDVVDHIVALERRAARMEAELAALNEKTK